MAINHTPGPWEVTHGDPAFPSVAVMASRNGRGICWLSNYDEAKDEDVANADLIAAAPDLLAALEKLDDAIGHEWVNERVADARDEAGKIIAKARGY